MTEYERGIRDAIRYRMTHKERWSESQTENSERYDDTYFFSVVPDRVNPGELLPGSSSHRDRMIELVTRAAIHKLITQV